MQAKDHVNQVGGSTGYAYSVAALPTGKAETLVMFHASKHQFDFPEVEASNTHRENHANGALGLWVSRQSDWIQGFGSNIYEVRFTGRVLDVPFEQFSKWGRGQEDRFFAARRAELLKQGIAYIRIVEMNGLSEMGVVVDLTSIDRFGPAQAPGQPDVDAGANEALVERPRY